MPAFMPVFTATASHATATSLFTVKPILLEKFYDGLLGAGRSFTLGLNMTKII